ncbi:MAG: acyl carrier protein [Clostridia bacterium]|nr:acyl carrier protein [Clostridia bacterium]MBR7032890.1 acyl carrier protein [Clostridia bacterium]
MEELLAMLSDLHPEVDFTAENDLIGDGILDSMDIVNLISGIADTFDVTITARDIIPENFRSADSIMALIRRLEEEG